MILALFNLIGIFITPIKCAVPLATLPLGGINMLASTTFAIVIYRHSLVLLSMILLYQRHEAVVKNRVVIVLVLKLLLVTGSRIDQRFEDRSGAEAARLVLIADVLACPKLEYVQECIGTLIRHSDNKLDILGVLSVIEYQNVLALFVEKGTGLDCIGVKRNGNAIAVGLVLNVASDYLKGNVASVLKAYSVDKPAIIGKPICAKCHNNTSLYKWVDWIHQIILNL